MSLKYNAARDAFGDGRMSWTAAKIVAQLVSAEYLATERHTDARDLKGLVGSPLVLSGKSIKDGWCTAAQMRFEQIRGGTVTALVIRRDAEAEHDKTLIVYLNDIKDFPMKTNGGDIVVDVPAKGLFRV